eukprot:CAMPEP_0198199942 /NCGR_PEP_ID=MMETSP1445-20131203/3040_1 /TAXON_ID=36898 /ORGANISM="Pyramimonas sp., Strain CCMP2087" /LENGTH=296 /DNA_ID=CAMNT_0043869853 /DNA_START=353 /DNA_END=1240 /DNA_ORIENTATION=+
MEKGTKWQKTLYAEQPFADNYTDPDDFLRELITNARFQPKNYWTVVCDAAMVTQEVSLVVAVSAAFTHAMRLSAVSNHDVLTCQLTAANVALLLGGWICRSLIGCDPRPNRAKASARLATPPKAIMAHGLRQASLLVVGVWFMSPLTQTLTYSISEDTIIATVVISFLFHLFLHDYSFMFSITDKLTGSTALGLAVFASVLMASRLPSANLVFALMLFSLEVFMLSPFLRRDLRRHSIPGHACLSLLLLLLAFLLCLPLSAFLAAAFLHLVLFITFLCPYFLTKIQKFKIQINGPW